MYGGIQNAIAIPIYRVLPYPVIMYPPSENNITITDDDANAHTHCNVSRTEARGHYSIGSSDRYSSGASTYYSDSHPLLATKEVETERYNIIHGSN